MKRAWRAGLLEKAGIACLSEMLIRSERLTKAVFIHDDETGAIGQSPFFVRTTFIKLPGT